MDSSLRSDSAATQQLQSLHSNLVRDLDHAKHKLEDVIVQIKLTSLLIDERQGEVENLQSITTEQTANFNAKLRNLEQVISTLQTNHQQTLCALHHDLTSKSDIVSEMEKELEDLQSQDMAINNVDCSMPNQDNLEKLQNENRLLQDGHSSLLKAAHEEKELLLIDQKRYEAIKEELDILLKSLAIKKSELAEKQEHINAINEELLSANAVMMSFKPIISHKEDLPEVTTSLFSEVNERRVVVQETVQSMKTNYNKIKEDQMRLEKRISYLQVEIRRLKSLYNRNMSNIQEGKFNIRNSLKSQLKMLKEILMVHDKNLVAQETTTNCTTYHLFQAAIEVVEDEVKCLLKKITDWQLSEHVFSSSLAKVKLDIEKLLITVKNLEKEIDRRDAESIKDKSVSDENNTVGENNIKHLQKPPVQTCLKSVNENFKEAVATKFLGISMIRGSGNYEHKSVMQQEKKTVKFTDDTVNKEQPPIRFRGKKVIFFPRKE